MFKLVSYYKPTGDHIGE